MSGTLIMDRPCFTDEPAANRADKATQPAKTYSRNANAVFYAWGTVIGVLAGVVMGYALTVFLNTLLFAWLGGAILSLLSLLLGGDGNVEMGSVPLSVIAMMVLPHVLGALMLFFSKFPRSLMGVGMAFGAAAWLAAAMYTSLDDLYFVVVPAAAAISLAMWVPTLPWRSLGIALRPLAPQTAR